MPASPAQTDAQPQALLAKYCQPAGDGRWSFGHSGFAHTTAAALEIIEACELLGVPVTDVATSSAWLQLVRKVVALEERWNATQSGRLRRTDWPA